MKKIIGFVLAVFLTLGLMACGGDEKIKASDAVATNSAKHPLKVCVVYSGNLGDASYNDSCERGIQKAAADFGVEVKSLEGSNAAEWRANFIAACEAGYDLVICSSSSFKVFMDELCQDYPDVKFAVLDALVEGENVLAVSFAQNQSAFLAGAAAALFTTKTNIPGVNSEQIIGWVGGVDIPLLRDYFIGYERGAKHINPEITIVQSFAATWRDPLKGKELALAQFKAGADIVMGVASNTGHGVLEAAKQTGKYAIGVDIDQDSEQAGAVLTSALKRVDTACYTIIESVAKDSFKGGNLYLGMKDGGVSLTDFSVIKKALGDNFPQDVVDKTMEIARQISSGEIVVPNYDGFGPK